MPTLRIAVPPGAMGFDAEQPGLNGLFVRLAYRRLLTYPPLEGSNTAAVPHLTPQLASGYEVSPDSRQVRVKLREARSAAGNVLSAEDVVWGWQRAFGLRDVGKWVALVGSVARAEDVVAIDDRTVEFRLRAPNPTLLQQLTRATPMIHDSAEARAHATASDPWARDWLRGHPAGFGAYTPEAITPWKEATFRAVDNAPIDTVQIRYVPGRQRRIDLLLAGEVDLLPSIEPADRDRLAGFVSQAPSGAHNALMLHCQTPPFDDKRVRQAVAYAVPYDRILAEVYGGTARPWRSAIPSTEPGSTDDFGRYRLLPDHARALLREAGLPNGFATELFVDGGDEEHLGCARLIAESLAEVGIKATVEAMDSSTFWFGARYIRPYPMLIYQDHHQVPDPYYALVHDYQSGKMGLINCGQFASPAVDAIIRRIEAEPNWEERAFLVREAHEVIAEECPSALLAQPAFLAAMRGIGDWYWLPDRSIPFETLTLEGR